MSKDDFTNNELKMIFQDIKHTLDRVEAQVIKTNGRVTALEFWKEGLMAKVIAIFGSISIVWIVIKEFINR